jgi:osmoprotectant transport system permease protein
MDLFRYFVDNWDALSPEVLDHLAIVLTTMAISALSGVGLGVLTTRRPRLGEAVLGIASTLLTIPSFALFAVLTTLFIAFGATIGDPPVVVGLVLYAQLPIIRNTRAGILAVDASVLEAARGMGMTRMQVLTRVELPLALPVILGGLRQATVMIVAITTVGATVGSNNLGRPILNALERSGSNLPIIAGTMLVAAIGIAADALLGLLQRALGRGRDVKEAAA